ncbi:uncharacterized protein LOC124349925 isoform X2 [Daphnia pulicaria]|nr:uncharacterized protein LOC124349925 isoform X2 [Daphnia pulicaria]XP_046656821.1 uncharacterized protein LOC124349925 isoform X2 [Daphnia pulicaria]
MSRNYFVLLAMSILSLRYCETKNVVFGSNDGSHSDEADHFTGGKLLKKPRYPWTIKDSADLIGRPQLNFDDDLVTIDERQSNGFNGSLKGDEAINRNRSCAVASSVPCSCVSETGACTCTNIACACIIAPCTINYFTGGSTFNSTRASSSSGSSSSDGSSSSGSTSDVSSTSSTSSSSLSVSTVCTGIYADPPCTCYVKTCVNSNPCSNTTRRNTVAPCPP